MYVFPLDADTRQPYKGTRGFKDATRDAETITRWWGQAPDSLVGVATGMSHLVVLDIDVKVDESGTVVKDGFESLARAWLDVPETFAYTSKGGLGRHLVYRAPEGKHLPRAIPYRKMVGVDRCSGEGFVAWNGPVPNEGDIKPAPEWLLDEGQKRDILQEFDGSIQQWYDSLVPGEPNALVRRAHERAVKTYEQNGNDFSHGEMIQAQHEAIRLGAEGNPGAAWLLEKLEHLFLKRTGTHSRGEQDWQYEWDESFVSGVQKHGALTELLVKLPKYQISLVPNSVKDSQITGEPLTSPGFTALLHKLVREISDNDQVATILWNAPAPAVLAREWGIQFLYTRIEEARRLPLPDTENPSLEEAQQQEEAVKGLLTAEERLALKYCWGFDEEYYQFARGEGFANEKLTRAMAWAVLSMAFGFKAFIPVSSTDRMGMNLWSMVLSESGTGKSRALKFRDAVLETLFPYEEGETGYDLGTDSSIQGLHKALLGRDRKASFFGTDEASGFFKKLNKNDWLSGMDDTLSDWYEGKVRPSSKLSLKELQGKSALTSFTIQMVATPGRLLDSLDREQFMSGFLARFNWTIGDPPKNTDDRFALKQNEEIREIEETPKVVELIANKLRGNTLTLPNSVPVLASQEALERMSVAYRDMYRSVENRKNWDIVEPSVTRLMEAMRKVAALSALNRGDNTTELSDALVAISVVEVWLKNLLVVAEKISQGEYQKNLADIELWIRARGGTVTKPKLYHQFKDVVKRGKRELDDLIEFLLESGIIVRKDEGGRIEYSINE